MWHAAKAMPRGQFLFQIEMFILEKIIYKKPYLYYKLAFYFFTFYIFFSTEFLWYLLCNTMMVIDTNTKPKENIFKRICKEVELEKVLLYSSLMIFF